MWFEILKMTNWKLSVKHKFIFNTFYSFKKCKIILLNKSAIWYNNVITYIFVIFDGVQI